MRPTVVNEATAERAAPSAAQGARFSLRGAAAEITIRGLLETLWRGWWLLLAAIVLVLLVTTVALKLSQPLYTASMIVAPAPTDLSAASQLASELEQFASLATLAQSPAKVERVSDLERYVQMIGSPTLAARLQAEHGLLQIVSRKTGTRRTRSGGGHTICGRRSNARCWGSSASRPGPSHVAALADWLSSRVTVARLGGSAMLRLRMDHPKPEFAASVVQMVHTAADGLLRVDALTRIGAPDRLG